MNEATRNGRDSGSRFWNLRTRPESAAVVPFEEGSCGRDLQVLDLSQGQVALDADIILSISTDSIADKPPDAGIDEEVRRVRPAQEGE